MQSDHIDCPEEQCVIGNQAMLIIGPQDDEGFTAWSRRSVSRTVLPDVNDAPGARNWHASRVNAFLIVPCAGAGSAVATIVAMFPWCLYSIDNMHNRVVFRVYQGIAIRTAWHSGCKR